MVSENIGEKLIIIADNMQSVYDSGVETGKSQGHEMGYNEGYETGITDGRQAEYKEFWDTYQEKGTRIDYRMAFAGRGWTDATFQPIYNMQPRNMYMFTYGAQPLSIVDMVELFKKQRITLDTSLCTNVQFAFANGKRWGVLDLRRANLAINVFQDNTQLETIDELIITKDQKFSDLTFQNCRNLIDLNITGTIGQNGLNLQWSTKLSYESLISIKDALEDKSSDTSGTTWLITVGSENKAKYTGQDLEVIRIKGWEVE